MRNKRIYSGILDCFCGLWAIACLIGALPCCLLAGLRYSTLIGVLVLLGMFILMPLPAVLLSPFVDTSGIPDPDEPVSEEPETSTGAVAAETLGKIAAGAVRFAVKAVLVCGWIIILFSVYGPQGDSRRR